ncbi:MAG: hypothetical protein KAG99_08135 [Bacteroidales bacterium]|nr:hypothetical protein [Bacteroidales bacterium]
MNCELIKEKIDQLVFEKNELTRAEVSGHIETCNSCKAYYEESMAANRIIGVIQKEPCLHDPAGLTNNILTVIDEVEQTPKSTKIINNGKIIRLIRRTLAAASVSLMIIFGVEQYIVLDKIIKLEDTTSNIPIEHSNINIRNLIRYNTDNQIVSFKQLTTDKPTNQNHIKLRTRIMLARISSITINEMDNFRINQLRKAIAAMNGN